MVKETVKITWNGMSIHVAPEFPLPLGEHIQHFAPLWKVSESADDYTKIISEALSATIASQPREINAECIGEYGRNLKSIRGIRDVIKKVAKFSKRRDVLEKLLNIDCEATLTYGALPKEINNKYDIVYANVPEKNETVVGYFGGFYNFVNRYKFDLSRMMVFEE